MQINKIYHNETDKSCCQILQRHFPDSIIDNRSIEDVRPDDVRKYKQCHFFAGIGGLSLGFQQSDINVWTGGFPCQDLSVAGKREGLAGSRSGLYFQFHRLITSVFPRWIVIENVPGLLSSNEGKDFAIVVGGLTGIVPEVPEIGWGNAGFFRGSVYNIAYRVLDAQFFGVAQRRRRVFIVGHLGDGRAAEVLFERESGGWDTPPRREAGQGVAGTLDAKSASSNRGSQANEHEFIVAHALSASPTATGGLDPNGQDFVTATLRGFGHGWQGQHNDTNAVIAYTIQQNDGGDHRRKDRPNGGIYVKEADQSSTVGSTDQTVIAFSAGQSSNSYGIAADEEVTPPIRAGESGTNRVPTIAWHNKQQSGEVRIQSDTVNAVTQQWGTRGNNVPFVGVRRLTPVECERLQGFPDGWTDGQADSTRYRQLGNAVAVPCAEWIARRIVTCSC